MNNSIDLLGRRVSEQTWKIGGFKGSVQSGQWSMSLSILTTTSVLAAAAASPPKTNSLLPQLAAASSFTVVVSSFT